MPKSKKVTYIMFMGIDGFKEECFPEKFISRHLLSKDLNGLGRIIKVKVTIEEVKVKSKKVELKIREVEG